MCTARLRGRPPAALAQLLPTPAPILRAPAPLLRRPAPLLRAPTPILHIFGALLRTPAPIPRTPAPLLRTPAPLLRISGALLRALCALLCLSAGSAWGQAPDTDQRCTPEPPAPIVGREALPAPFSAELAALSALLARGQPQLAQRRLHLQRRRWPAADQPLYRYLLARAHLALKQPALAAPILSDLHALWPDLRPHLRTLLRQAQAPTPPTEAAPSPHPRDFEPLLSRALEAVQGRRFAEASEALGAAWRSATQAAQRGRVALLGVAQRFTRHRDPEERLRALIEIFRQSPSRLIRAQVREILRQERWPADLRCAEWTHGLWLDVARRKRLPRRLPEAPLHCADELRGLPALLQAQLRLHAPKRPLRTPPRPAAKIVEPSDHLAAALMDSPGPATVGHLWWTQAKQLRADGALDLALSCYTEAALRGQWAPHRAAAALEGARLAQKLHHTHRALALAEIAAAQFSPAEQPKQHAQALWLYGWLSWRAGAHAQAEAAWAQLSAVAPDLRDGSLHSYRARATYWQGRALEALGQPALAHAQWANLWRDFPLSYYAQLADARLPADARGPTHFAEWPGDQSLSVPEPAEAAEALWLWRLGLHEEAREDLHQRLSVAQLSPDGALLLVQLYGALRHEAFAVMAQAQLLKEAPEGRAQAHWRAAFPRPFRALVYEIAAENQLDPHLIWAVMRQESAFKPTARSRAQALGLMQLLSRTARDVARGLGDPPPKIADLYEPERNLRYGAAYLRRLLQRYQGDLVLTLAAYNAGMGNVGDWVKRIGHLHSDEFIEAIPFDEARGYVRKVLRSYAIYRTLYEADRPAVLPWTPPHDPIAPQVSAP